MHSDDISYDGSDSGAEPDYGSANEESSDTSDIYAECVTLERNCGANAGEGKY